MFIVILIASLFFALGASAVPILRAVILHRDESHKTISDGLFGVYHWFATGGFIALTFGLVWLGVGLNSPISLLAWLVALGVFGAMVTDSFRKQLMKLTRWTNDKCARLHLDSAKLAFVGALFLEIGLAWTAPHYKVLLWCLVAAYPVAVGLVYLLWPKYTAWQEWTGAAAIVAFLVVRSIVGLHYG